MAQRTCPNCGMQESEWLGSHRQGWPLNGKLYCCNGCAAGTGCICRAANQGFSGDAIENAEADTLMRPRDRNGRILDESEIPTEASQLLSTEQDQRRARGG